MASGLRVELSEESLAASPGGAVTTRCTVYNASLIVDEYKLEVSGIDPAWVEAPPLTSRIFPEAFETVTFTFKPPRAANVVAGDYPFTITASSETFLVCSLAIMSAREPPPPTGPTCFSRFWRSR